MYTSILEYWRYGSKFCSIELTSIDDFENIFATVAKKRKGEFIDFEYFDSKGWLELSTALTKNQHAQLIVSSDQVLIKEIELEVEVRKAVVTAFPGLQLSEFYFDLLHTEFKTFVAVCRKDVIDGYITSAKEVGIHILSVSLGFSAIQHVIKNIEETSVHTASFEFNLKEKQIQGFLRKSTMNHSHVVGDIEVPCQYLLSMAGLLTYFSPNLETNLIENNRSLEKSQAETIFFKKGMIVGIVILLVLLIINFFFYTHYSSEYVQLSESVEMNSLQKENLEAQLDVLKKKESLVNDILSNSSSKSSFYINKIATSAPITISFKEITYQPLLKSIRPDKEIESEKKILIIIGESTDKESYSDWIEQIESWSWVESLTITNYEYSTSDRDKFALQIKIGDETKN